jgi:hypothetical protein
MSVDPTQVNGSEDESQLDAEIQASIETVKAGKPLAGQTGEEAPKGSTGTAAPEGEQPKAKEAAPAGEAPSGETSANDDKGEDAEFRLPNKGKFESDEAYEKRVELFDLVKRRKAATTPEAKAAINAEIAKAKGDLRAIGSAERFIKTRTDGAPAAKAAQEGEEDPNLVADREKAKKLGLATQEDIEAAIAQTQHDAAVRSDLQKFVEAHAKLQDEDVREVFFDFVEQNYVWQGKSGKELAAVLSMAYENMFRPAETVEARVLKAAGVAEKVNAMQFPGGTSAKPSYPPELKQSIDELKATGMSEEKAIELLSD